MINVIFSVGVRETSLSLSEGTSMGEILSSSAYRSEIGFSESSTPFVNGSPVQNGYTFQDGDDVSFERKASSKA